MSSGDDRDVVAADEVGDDSSDDETQLKQYKVILLGDGAVGKTSITMRFAKDFFALEYKQTIGLDFFIKRLKLPGGIEVALQLWDIGGQQLGSRMLSNYIYGSDAVILCYDLTNLQSFQNLEDWYRLVKDTYKDEDLPYVALLGNKTDLAHMQEVSRDLHNTFAEEHKMRTIFMSAKSGDNVNRSFLKIAGDLSGVAVSKQELDAAQDVLRADIVEHPTERDPIRDAKLPQEPAAEPTLNRKGKKKCIIQ